MMQIAKKGPDVASAAKVGEPSLADPEPVAATSVVRSETFAAAGVSEKSVGVEIVKPDQPTPDATAPTSDATPAGGSPFGRAASGTTSPADTNELKPTDSAGDQALPPPPQVNEIHSGESSSATASADSSAPASDAELSSSKKKRKKGLKKIVPF